MLMSSHLISALQLFSNGYIPLPIQPNTKKPALPAWQQLHFPDRVFGKDDMLDDEFVVTEQWVRVQDWSGGLGVSCSDNLVIVDIDDPALVAQMRGGLPPTIERTGRDDRTALIYRTKEPVIGRKLKPFNIDILALGRQAVLPPSVHPETGKPYRWLSGRTLFDTPISELPILENPVETCAGLLGIVLPVETTGAGKSAYVGAVARQTDVATNPGAYQAYAAKAVKNECEALAGMPKGGRNLALLESSMRLARFVHAEVASIDTVRESLIDACVANGLVDDPEDGMSSCLRTVEQGLKYGAKRPLEKLADAAQLFKGIPAILPPGAWRYPAPAPIAADFELFDNQMPPPPEMLIYDVLPAGAGIVTLLAGQSGSGKSFVGASLAVALDTGTPFLEYANANPDGMPVTFFAAEGAGQLRERLCLAARHVRQNCRQTYLYTDGMNFLDDAWRNSIISKVKPGGVVIIDSIMAACALEDASDAVEAARVMRMLRAFGQEVNCAVVAIAHMGKDQSVGVSGSHQWKGQAEHVLALTGERNEVEGEIKNRRLVINKSRITTEGPLCRLDIEPVSTGATDRRGIERIGAVIVRGAGDPRTKKTNFFDQAYDRVAFRKKTPHVLIDDLRSEFCIIYPLNGNDDISKQQNAMRQAWNRALKDALKSGFTLDTNIIYKSA